MKRAGRPESQQEESERQPAEAHGLAPKRVALRVHVPRSEILARLQKASGWHERNVIPDSLRVHGIDGLDLIVLDDGRFRIDLSALENAYRPRMEIEGWGEVSGETSVRFELRATRGSMWTIGTAAVVLLGLAVYNLVVLDPPNKLAYGIFVFVPALVAWCWMQLHVLADRAWPGTLAFVKRLLINPVHDPPPETS